MNNNTEQLINGIDKTDTQRKSLKERELNQCMMGKRERTEMITNQQPKS
jgi:hypothetical protein